MVPLDWAPLEWAHAGNRGRELTEARFLYGYFGCGIRTRRYYEPGDWFGQ